MTKTFDFKLKLPNSFQHTLLVILFFIGLYIIFFSPVLFSDRLLAPGDGLVQSVPAYYSHRTLWTPLLQAGFPAAADIQTQTWYPISIILSLIPDSWNIFVLSAYVLASCFTYGYIFSLTHSKFAAIFGGIVYGMSGFMMAHLGHTNMIHSATWLPLVIWSIEQLRHCYSKIWLGIGVLAISFSFLAGHPQISVYTMGLSFIYACFFGWTAPIGRWKYYSLYLVTISLGIALSSIQIIPNFELSQLGLRKEMDFANYNSYSLPMREVMVRLIFPYILGGPLTEIVGYVGILPLIFASISFINTQKKKLVIFWLIIVLVCLLLSTGYSTPLSWLSYQIPLYNKFRILPRHYMEMSLAISILSSLAVSQIQKQKAIDRRLLMKVLLISLAIFSLSLISIFLIMKFHHDNLMFFYENIYHLKIDWYLPIFVFVISLGGIFSFDQKFKNSQSAKIIIILILIINMASFGWFYEWNFRSPYKTLLNPPLNKYAKLAENAHQRILPIVPIDRLDSLGQSILGELMVPNISRLWNVTNASGYGPFILSRYSELLSMSPNGAIIPNLNSQDRSIDLASIRYIFSPKLITKNDRQGISWSKDDLDISLGSGCGKKEPSSFEVNTPSVQANIMGIVSLMGCSNTITNQTEVLKVSIIDITGKTITKSLKAGIDTSEWAYERSDILPYIKHERAQVFESFPAQNFQGHKYVTFLPLEKLDKLKKIHLELTDPNTSLDIKKITFIDNINKVDYPFNTFNHQDWVYLAEFPNTIVYENLNAMPRAWLVPEVMTAKSKQILNAIKSSKLPNSQVYDPSKIALIEEDFSLKAETFDSSSQATIASVEDTKLVVETHSLSPSFLVLSDVFYPGWQAKVDGKIQHIYQTNYIFRGLPLSPGKHNVTFEFKPLSFHLGLGISLASLALFSYILFFIPTRYNIYNKH